MAKVTITIEDIADGVSIKMDSDPPFPGPDAAPEQTANFTDAMHWALAVGEWLAQQSMRENEEHVHDENCSH
jgi:hypothetical protein